MKEMVVTSIMAVCIVAISIVAISTISGCKPKVTNEELNAFVDDGYITAEYATNYATEHGFTYVEE